MTTKIGEYGFTPLGLLEEERLMNARASPSSWMSAEALRAPIASLELADPPTMRPASTAREAVDHMIEAHRGAVLVVDDAGTLVGIFTERDALRSGEPGFPDRTLEEVMTPRPETLPPDASLAFALNLMTVGGYRYVPIVVREDRPIALLSMRRVVEHVCARFPEEILNLPPRAILLDPATREGA